MNTVQYRLIGINNNQSDKRYVITSPILLGRSTSCDVFLADVRASRQQARVQVNEDGVLLIQDLGSSNGSFVNGEQITSRRLEHGDRVVLGTTEFVVEVSGISEVVGSTGSQLNNSQLVTAMPVEAELVKPTSTMVLPSLASMKANDYLEAIGVGELGVEEPSLSSIDSWTNAVSQVSKDTGQESSSKPDQKTPFERLQLKTRNFATLLNISTLTQNHNNIDGMLTAVLDVLLKVPGGDAAHVLMLNEDDELKVRVSRDVIGGHSQLSLSNTVSHYVMETQNAVVASDLRNDERFSAAHSVIFGLSDSTMAVPIIIGGDSVGLIAVSCTGSSEDTREDDLDLLCLSANLVGQAIRNLELQSERARLLNEIEETQREVVLTMGAIGETRSKETGNHVKRVAEYSRLLATLYGCSEADAELLKQASPMHDIGKVGIPDSILNKPGRLTADEWVVMKTHARLGYDMLSHSNRPILKAAAIVAHEHHEKWNGSGYPRGLSGDDIHIYGRITAVADVFDALGSARCYKKAWPLERILGLFEEERGEHFDPYLVELLLNNLDQFLVIRDLYKDSNL